jgi:hypothetical protein
MRSGYQKTVVPHVGQKWKVTSNPLSDARVNVFDAPLPDKFSCSKNAAIPNALPVRFWHSRQWHSETLRGLPTQLAVRPPQAHVASRRIMMTMYQMQSALKGRHSSVKI